MYHSATASSGTLTKKYEICVADETFPFREDEFAEALHFHNDMKSALKLIKKLNAVPPLDKFLVDFTKKEAEKSVKDAIRDHAVSWQMRRLADIKSSAPEWLQDHIWALSAVLLLAIFLVYGLIHCPYMTLSQKRQLPDLDTIHVESTEVGDCKMSVALELRV